MNGDSRKDQDGRSSTAFQPALVEACYAPRVLPAGSALPSQGEGTRCGTSNSSLPPFPSSPARTRPARAAPCHRPRPVLLTVQRRAWRRRPSCAPSPYSTPYQPRTTRLAASTALRRLRAAASAAACAPSPRSSATACCGCCRTPASAAGSWWVGHCRGRGNGGGSGLGSKGKQGRAWHVGHGAWRWTLLVEVGYGADGTADDRSRIAACLGYASACCVWDSGVLRRRRLRVSSVGRRPYGAWVLTLGSGLGGRSAYNVHCSGPCWQAGNRVLSDGWSVVRRLAPPTWPLNRPTPCWPTGWWRAVH